MSQPCVYNLDDRIIVKSSQKIAKTSLYNSISDYCQNKEQESYTDIWNKMQLAIINIL